MRIDLNLTRITYVNNRRDDIRKVSVNITKHWGQHRKFHVYASASHMYIVSFNWTYVKPVKFTWQWKSILEKCVVGVDITSTGTFPLKDKKLSVWDSASRNLYQWFIPLFFPLLAKISCASLRSCMLKEPPIFITMLLANSNGERCLDYCYGRVLYFRVFSLSFSGWTISVFLTVYTREGAEKI